MPAKKRKTASPPEPVMPTEAEFQALLAEANKGSQPAIKQLKQLLDEQPHIWQHVGDMGKQAEERLVQHIAKGNMLVVESVRRELEVMRADLLDGQATRMERLLVDRVVICWLRLQYLDVVYPSGDGLAAATAKLVMQQRESAQRLLNSAQSALQTFRKLAPPKLRIARATIPFPTDRISQKAQ